MRTVLLASLRTHTRRYVSAALAVVIGVAFVIVTAGLSAAAKRGPDRRRRRAVRGRRRRRHRRRRRARRPPGARGPRRRRGGRACSAGPSSRCAATAPSSTTAPTWATSRPTPTCAGRPWSTAPSRPEPARPRSTLDRTTADRRARRPARDRRRHPRRHRHRGRPGRLAVGAGQRLGLPDLARRARLGPTASTSTAWPGRAPQAAVTAIAPDATVTGHDTFVDERQTEVNNGVNVMADRPAALRRHRPVRLGAGHRQHVLDPVRPAQPRLRPAPLRRRHPPPGAALDPRRVARASGLVAVTLGLVVGTASAASAWWRSSTPGGPRPGWARRRSRCPGTPAAWSSACSSPLVAAWLPTRRAVRASPLAALRPETDIDVRTAAGRLAHRRSASPPSRAAVALLARLDRLPGAGGDARRRQRSPSPASSCSARGWCRR